MIGEPVCGPRGTAASHGETEGCRQTHSARGSVAERERAGHGVRCINDRQPAAHANEDAANQRNARGHLEEMQEGLRQPRQGQVCVCARARVPTRLFVTRAWMGAAAVGHVTFAGSIGIQKGDFCS